MLNIFRRSLRTGVVTTAYPDVAEEAPAAFRGQVMLQPARCTGDGACARVCPSGAIAVVPAERGWVWELDDARCVFCGLCVDACPATALSLSGAYELAVRERADLVTRVEFVAGAEGGEA